jgi:hypothetical protein
MDGILTEISDPFALSSWHLNGSATVGRTNRKLMPPRATQLQERANYCRRMAVGAADRKFAAMLLTLAAEYEMEVTRVQAQREVSTAPRKVKEIASAHATLSG